MPKKRTDQILDILREQGYVTVQYLTEQLHYSTATINRDLNFLKKQNLVIRHYGGVELVSHKGVPLVFRYHKMRPVKNLLGKKAAEIIQDGDTVFIDGSTTSQCMGKFIVGKKDLTVISNNMNLLSYLSEYDIKCICLGGTIVESPYMLGGTDTEEQAKSYIANTVFFSVGGVSSDGIIYTGDMYISLLRIMAKNAKRVVLLVDHQKIDVMCSRILFDFSKVDYVISDYDFPVETTLAFPKTNFIKVEKT